MAITTYAQLQSSLGWYANRDDLFSNITNFTPAAIDPAVQIAIAAAEDRIDKDIITKGGTKYSQTINNTLVTVGQSETLTMPTDFGIPETLFLTTDPYTEVKFYTPRDLFATWTSATVTGAPRGFTIIGTSTAYLRPVPDGVYNTRLIYKAKLTPLSSTNASNWLLVNGLRVYIAASMLELTIMLENEDKMGVWANNYSDAMDSFMGVDLQTRFATVTPVPRPQGNVA